MKLIVMTMGKVGNPLCFCLPEGMIALRLNRMLLCCMTHSHICSYWTGMLCVMQSLGTDVMTEFNAHAILLFMHPYHWVPNKD